jgi:hypothetical protein
MKAIEKVAIESRTVNDETGMMLFLERSHWSFMGAR